MSFPLITRSQQNFLLLTQLAVKGRQALSPSCSTNIPFYSTAFAALQSLGALQDSYLLLKDAKITREKKYGVIASIVLSPVLYHLAYKTTCVLQTTYTTDKHALALSNTPALSESLYRLSHVAHIAQLVSEIYLKEKTNELFCQLALHISCLLASHQITYLYSSIKDINSKKILFDKFFPLPLPQEKTCAYCRKKTATFPLPNSGSSDSCLPCLTEEEKSNLFHTASNELLVEKNSFLSKLKIQIPEDFYLSVLSPTILLIEKALINLFKEEKISLKTFSLLLLSLEAVNCLKFVEYQLFDKNDSKKNSVFELLPKWTKAYINPQEVIAIANGMLFLPSIVCLYFLMINHCIYFPLKGTNRIPIINGQPCKEFLIASSYLPVVLLSYIGKNLGFSEKWTSENLPTNILNHLLTLDMLLLAWKNPKNFCEMRHL